MMKEFKIGQTVAQLNLPWMNVRVGTVMKVSAKTVEVKTDGMFSRAYRWHKSEIIILDDAKKILMQEFESVKSEIQNHSNKIAELKAGLYEKFHGGA